MLEPSPLVTTWALVAISPLGDTTKPEPSPARAPCGARGFALPPPANSLITVTTPGA